MDFLIKELKKVMEDNGLSQEKTARFIDVSQWTIHRWLTTNFAPNCSSRHKIREGIKKIKEAYPDKGEQAETIKKTKDYYLKIENKLTEEEKVRVQNLHFMKGPEASFEMLQELDTQHQSQGKVKIQMFQSKKKE